MGGTSRYAAVEAARALAATQTGLLEKAVASRKPPPMNTPSEPAGWSSDLADDLKRRANACRELDTDDACASDHYRLIGKAAAYDHAAELVMALAPPSSLDGGGRDGLRLFAKAVLRDGLWDGGSLDGADIQALAEKHGLIECVPFDPEKHVDHHGVCVEAGEDWYVETAALASAPLPVGEQGVSPSRDLRSDASPALEGWRTIDSAWREGEQRILLTDGCSVHAGYWYSREACWLDCDGIIPTHWQPLPQPPVQQTDSDKSRAEPPSPPLADGEAEKEGFGSDLSQPHRLSGSHTTDQRSTS